MTEVLLPTRKAVRELFLRTYAGSRVRIKDEVLDRAIDILRTEMRSMAYASTFASAGSPIVLWGLDEEHTVEVLVHEEDHRALDDLGEVVASSALDRPTVFRLIARACGRPVPKGYGRSVARWRLWKRASPKTEAR